MKKTYKCSNIKFCMEDEKQRRTWEYLQGITRKDGSYGKILSDAFAAALDGETQIRADDVMDSRLELSEQSFGELVELLDRVLEQKFHKMLQEMQKVFAEQMSRAFIEYMRDSHFGAELSEDKADADGMGRMQEPELSEDMMAFAFAMGE
ncbi:MAG: hypothetical protein K1W41_15835 [Lachnospiraceae bacterium]